MHTSSCSCKSNISFNLNWAPSKLPGVLVIVGTGKPLLYSLIYVEYNVRNSLIGLSIYSPCRKVEVPSLPVATHDSTRMTFHM